MTALKLADLDDLVDSEISAEIYTVTPAVAKRWLSRNVRNRSVRQDDVDAYARDMAAGNWHVTGEAIKFDTNGALADGQHRLHAVIKSGVSIQILVVRGVEPDAQKHMDTGAKRSAGDALTLAGEKNATILAAIASLAIKEPGCGYVDQRSAKPTHAEIADFVDEHPDIRRAAEMASYYYPQFDAAPSVLGICWMRFSDIDLPACAEFFSSIANLRTDGAGDPRLALIRRLANARRDRERISQYELLSLIFRTWNAWRAGKAVGRFQSNVRGDMVKIPERLR